MKGLFHRGQLLDELFTIWIVNKKMFLNNIHIEILAVKYTCNINIVNGTFRRTSDSNVDCVILFFQLFAFFLALSTEFILLIYVL